MDIDPAHMPALAVTKFTRHEDTLQMLENRDRRLLQQNKQSM
jgi:hypothetical protein